jgi:integrase/recombinase XerD
MMGLRASEMADLTVESLTNVRGYVTLTFIGKGDKPARVPVPLPALPAIHDAISGRSSGPLLRTRTGAGMDRRSVHRYVAHTARVAGIGRPIGPHALRRTVGTVGLNQGIPLRDIQRLLRHTRPGDHPGQLRHHRRCPRTACLASGGGLPRRRGELTRRTDTSPAPRCPQDGF